MKGTDRVHRGLDVAELVEGLLQRPLTESLRREFREHPMNLHQVAAFGDAAAARLSPSAASIVRTVRELIAAAGERWDREAGAPPVQPTWLIKAARKTASLSDAEVIEAGRRLGL